MERVRTILHAEEAHRAGITGYTVTAAVLDTGICDHPDFVNRISVFHDLVNGKKNYYDDASHGSHVSGILCGDGSCSNGRYCGIAPGCRIIHLKVLDRYGQGKIETIAKAVAWTIENREKYRIRILNLSAGASDHGHMSHSIQLVRLVDRAWDAGIVVVVAAGNGGPSPGSITAPGNSRKVITVGAYEIRRPYSGCGPTSECIRKPELIAPGTGIMSCSPHWRNHRFYERKSGTSMAAPAVAGSIALLLEKERNLNNVEVKMRLKESCVKTEMSENCQGWGMPDLRRLLRLPIKS